MTDELKEKLMAIGLNKQQVNSLTAEKLVDFFMNDDAKALILEAQRQVYEMKDIVISLRQEARTLKEKIDTVAGNLLAIVEAQDEYGALTDEKAKNALIFYAALLKMNERAGARGSENVESASYDLYAFLGGQAKRDIHYDRPHDDDD